MDNVKVIESYPAQDTLTSIVSESKSNGGGPYNVLKDLSAMQVGYPLAACGLVGDDGLGRGIRRDCISSNIDIAQLHVTRERATSYTDVMSVRDTGRRTFFHQRGANALFDMEHVDLAQTRARIFYLGYLMLLDQLDQFDAVGRSRGSRLIESARESGMTTFVDLVTTEHRDYHRIVSSALPYIDHLVLNENEASKLVGRELAEDDAEVLLEAAGVILDCGVGTTVTIHTRVGAVTVSSTGEKVVQPSLVLTPAYIQGSCGAGDAFAAGLLHGLHEGLPPSRCLHLAICVAAASLSHPSPSEGVRSLDDCLALGEQFGRHPFTVQA